MRSLYSYLQYQYTYILNWGPRGKASVILFTGIEVEKRILFLYVSYLKLPEPGLAEIFIV